MDEDEGRRFFIGMGTGRYRDLGRFGQLPQVSSDIIAMREMCSRFGYKPVLLGLGEYDSAAQIREKLSLWTADAALTNKDVILVYYAGHGVVEERDRHYLLCWDSRTADCAATALPTEDLVRVLCQGELGHLLIILDTCASGSGAADAAGIALQSIAYRRTSQHNDTGLWFLASAHYEEGAEDGLFVSGLDDAIRTATERTGQRQRFVDLTELIRAVNDGFESHGRSQRAVLAGGLITGLAPFIPNVGFRADLPPLGTDLEIQRRVVDEDLTEHFGPRSRGVEFESEQGLYFSGRERALSELVGWLTATESDGRGRLVTGSPGCGKSAVLGRIVALSIGHYRVRLNLTDVDPATVMPEGSVTAGVHARHKRLPEIVERIATAIGIDTDSPTALLQELSRLGRRRSRPLVVVVDALDEAGSGTSADAGGHGEPRRIARELLRPMSQIPGVRLVVGTRRELITSLGQAIKVIDLDRAKYRADQDVAGYVRKVLLAAEEPEIVTPYRGQPVLADVVARGVARRADGVFLVARMTARSLRYLDSPVNVESPGWAESLPSEIGAAFDDYLGRFGDAEPRVRRMLRPLAFAEGLGLPRGEIWTTLSTALADGIPCTEEDVTWVLSRAQAYIAEVVEDSRSVYRLYHQALAEHLRGTAARPAEHVQASIVSALTSIVPVAAERQAPDWFSAAPYVRQYLSTHARAAGQLDTLIQDPGFLLASGQLALLSALQSISSEDGRLIRTAYEQIAHRLSASFPLSRRAADLQLSARRCGADALAEKASGLGIPLPWLARWAWWSKAGAHRQLSGHQRSVWCVAVATLDGHPIAITGSGDKTAKIWDLVTQQQIGKDLQVDAIVSSVTVGDIDDYTVALTGGADGTVRIWDLSTGQEYGSALVGHTNRIRAIAIRNFGSRAIVVTASADGTARIWDLGSRTQLGQPLTAHRRSVNATALGELEGSPIALTGGDDKRVYIWDLAEADKGNQTEWTGRPLIGFAGAVQAVALGDRDGQLVAVAGDETGTLSVWDLAERQQIGEPVVAHKYYLYSGVRSVAIGRVDNSQIVLSSGAFDARLWYLDGLRQLGHPMRGHVDLINAGALSMGGDFPVAVTVSIDRTARIWDLTADQPATGHVEGVRAAAFAEIDGRPLALTGGSDGTARLWNLRTRTEVIPPLEGHAGDVLAVSLGSVLGLPVAVTGGSDATIRFWDLTRGCQAGPAIEGHTNAVRCVKITKLRDRDVAVTAGEDGTIRLWDIESRTRIGEPLTGHLGAIRQLEVLSSDTSIQIAAVTTSGHAYLWQVTGDNARATREAHLDSDLYDSSDSIVGISFCDSKPVVFVATVANSLQCYDIRSGKSTGPVMIGHRDIIYSAIAGMRWDRIAVATVGYDGVRLWDLNNGMAIGDLIRGELNVQCSFVFAQISATPVGLVAFKRQFRLWDLHVMHPIGEPLCGNNSRVTGISIVRHRARNVVITAGEDGAIRTHALDGGEQIAAHVTASRQIIASAAIDTNSGVLAAASKVDGIDVWNLSTREHIGIIRNYGGLAFCLSICQLQSGPAVVIGTGDAEVHAWDLMNWAPICEYATGHTASIRSVCARILNDQPIVGSASADGTVRFWHLETGQAVADPMNGHARGANAVDVGMIGDRLIALSGSGDGQVKIWGLESHDSVDLNFEPHPDGIAAVRLEEFSGRPFAITADSNGLVRAWDLTTGKLQSEAHVGSGITDIAATAEGDICVATNMGAVALRLNIMTASAVE